MFQKIIPPVTSQLSKQIHGNVTSINEEENGTAKTETLST